MGYILSLTLIKGETMNMKYGRKMIEDHGYLVTLEEMSKGGKQWMVEYVDQHGEVYQEPCPQTVEDIRIFLGY